MGRGPGKRKFPRVGNYSKPRGCEKIYEVNFVRFPGPAALKKICSAPKAHPPPAENSIAIFGIIKI